MGMPPKLDGGAPVPRSVIVMAAEADMQREHAAKVVSLFIVFIMNSLFVIGCLLFAVHLHSVSRTSVLLNQFHITPGIGGKNRELPDIQIGFFLILG
jgi:hypothetical protein